MPVYTYRCENCGVLFEKTQKFSDQPLTRCPECNKKSLHKVYTPVGIVFKGSGFYSTDHRSASGQGHVRTESSSESKDTSTKEAASKDNNTKDSSSKETTTPVDEKKTSSTASSAAKNSE